MKTGMRVSRKDSLQDHSHSLPEGKVTSGMLLKPSQSLQFPMHSHLYSDDGITYETRMEMDMPGHTHDTIWGESSGPQVIAGKTVHPVNVQAAELGEKV